MQFDAAVTSARTYFQPGRHDLEMDKPLILIHEKKISTCASWCRCWKRSARPTKALLIIAEDI